MRKLQIAVLIASVASVISTSSICAAAPVAVIQKINGTSITSGTVQQGNARTLTVVGYAGDLATHDAGNVSAVILRNVDNGNTINVPVVRRIASPDALIASAATRAPAAAGTLFNAGFLAVADAYTIPDGTYEVYGVSAGFGGATSTTTFAASAKGTLQVPKERTTDDVQLVGADGVATPLSLRQMKIAGGGTAMALSGYPALRNGSYVVRATTRNKYGRSARQDALTVQYVRPTVKVDISSPAVDGFPGLPKQVTLASPLDGSLLSGPLSGKAILAGEVAGRVTVQGQDLATATETDLVIPQKSAGRYQVTGAASGNRGTVRMWINSPDAPDLEMSVGNWDPDAGIKVAKDKDAYAPSLDAVQVNVVSESGSNCFGVYGVNGDTPPSGQYEQPACAVRYKRLPDGVAQEGSGRANLRGALLSDGEQAVELDTGVVWTNPDTGETKFFKAKERSLTLTGILPKEPEIAFAPIDKLVQLTKASPGKYLTYAGPTTAGRLTVTGRYPGMTVSIKIGNGEAKVVSTNNTSVRQFINTSAGQIWDSQDVVVESWYNKYPAKKFTKTLPFTAIPKEPVVVVTNGDAVSTADTVVRGNLGVYLGGSNGFSYNPTDSGAWTVQLYEEDSKGARTAIGDAIPITEADGSFSVNLGKLPPGRKSVVAVGTISDGAAGVGVQQITSTKASVLIKDGTPLVGTIQTRQTSGAIPFSPTLNVTLENSTRVADIGKVEWFRSTDGESFEALPDTNFALRPELKTSSKAWFKATLTNRHSGLTSDLAPIEIQAFAVPKVTIGGDTATFVGHPATLTAQADIDADFTWFISASANDKNPQVVTGADSITVTPTSPADMLIKLVASEKNAPANNPVKNVSVTTMLRAVRPGVQKPMIYGPGYVETGKSYDFKASVAPLFAPGLRSSLTLKGRWVLPDGSTQDGDTISYTVQLNDKSLRYEAWVDGVDGVTAASDFGLRTWTYTWPDWQVVTRVVDNRVPATLRLTAVLKSSQDAQKLGGEKPTYSWEFPPSFKVIEQRDSSLTLEANEPGDFQVYATIADSRGNSTQVSSDLIKIAPAPDLIPDLAIQSGDRWNRAPNKLYARVNLLSVPKNDVVDTTTFKLNGTEVASGRGIASYIDVQNPGVNEITAIVRSVGGKVGMATKTIELSTGDNPTCQIAQMGDGKSSLTLTAKCTVQAGLISSYKWTVNGIPMPSASYMLSFAKKDLDAGVTSVHVTATTDKGQEGSASWPQ